MIRLKNCINEYFKKFIDTLVLYFKKSIHVWNLLYKIKLVSLKFLKNPKFAVNLFKSEHTWLKIKGTFIDQLTK